MDEIAQLSITEFVTHLRNKNFSLNVKEGRLTCTGTIGVTLLAAEREYINQHKQEIITHLQTQEVSKQIESIFPLSPLQQGMLFHYLQAPDGDSYLLQLGFRLRGELDPILFKTAWQTVINQYDILRSRLVWEQVSHPVHVVQQHVDIQWQTLDWQAEQDNLSLKFDEFMQQDRARGFDLSMPCAMRFCLIKIDAKSFYFLWTKHHIIIDGWSSAQLIGQVFFTYGQLKNNTYQTVTVPRFQSFVHWLKTCDQERAQQFWRDYLQGFTTPTCLDFGLKPLGYQALKPIINRAQTEITFTAADSQKMRAFVQQQGVTLNTLFQYAWAKLLSVYSGSDDIVFAVAFSGRSYPFPHLRTSVGLFVNTLPVRVRFNATQTIAESLLAFNAAMQTIDEMSYFSLPDVKKCSELPAETPLFYSLFTFENYFVDASVHDNIAHWQIDEFTYRFKTHFPLQIQITPNAEIQLRIFGDLTHFTQSMMDDLIENYQYYLSMICQNSAQSHLTINPVCESQAQRFLYDWNRGEVKSYSEETVHDAWRRKVSCVPTAPALISEHEILSFAEVNRRANIIAAKIQQYFPDKTNLAGEIIAITAPRSIEVAIMILAILKTGAAYLPIVPTLPLPRQLFMLADAAVKLLLSHDIAEITWPTSINVLPFSAIDMAVTAVTEINQMASVAYILYTSGSTGQPKGVVCYHRSILNRFNWYSEHYPFAPDEKCCQKAALTFVDSLQEFFCPLLNGISVRVVPQTILDNPGEFIQFLREQKITRLEVVPSLLRIILEECACKNETLPLLRWWISSGEALPPDMVNHFRQQFPTAYLLNRFGSTESSTTLWFDTQSWQGEGRLPIGKPIANTNVYVLNDELKPVPQGVIGELYIAGVGIAKNYLNQPELNEQRFLPGCFDQTRLFRSGDLVRYLPDCTLEYHGRYDQQVKLNGIRVDLAEIESILLKHDSVKEVCVMLRVETTHKLVAFIVSADFSAELLKQHAECYLPTYMVPSLYIPLDQIPLNAHGKRDSVYLNQIPITDYVVRKTGLAAKTLLEKTVLECCQQIIGVESLSLSDHFFNLGGDSIAAIRLTVRLQQLVGVSCSLIDVLTSVNLQALANRLQAALQNASFKITAQTPNNLTTDLPLSYAQRRIWFLQQMQLQQDATFHLASAFKIHGKLDINCLTDAVNLLLFRHESLRTAFRYKNDKQEPVADVLSAEAINVAHIKVSPVDISKNLESEFLKPFDLENGYLFRVTLFSVDANTQYLLIVFHHIIMDAWSSDIFLNELAVVYAALFLQKKVELPPIPLRYVDFSLTQRQQYDTGDRSESLAYWQKKLLDYQYLHLIKDFNNSASYEGGKCYFMIERDSFTALKNFNREHASTTYITLLAVTHLLLAMHAKQDDFIMGTPITHRQQQELEQVLGVFLNLLPLRNQVVWEQSFADFLAQVKKTWLEALQQQQLPFEFLVEALARRDDNLQAPFFPVMMVLHVGLGLATPTVPGVNLESVQLTTMPAKYDLIFNFTEDDQGLSGFIQYRTDLYQTSTVQALADLLTYILRVALKTPQQKLSLLNFVEPTASSKTLAWGTGMPQFFVVPSVDALFTRIATQCAETIAIETTEQFYSYKTLLNEANKLAGYLQQNYLTQKEDRIVVNLTLGYEWLLSMLSIFIAGGVYVPLDPVYPEKRRHQIIEDCQPVLVLHAENIKEFYAAAMSANKTAEPVKSPQCLAYILYTSGTTGKPKGVMIEHNSLLNYVGWIQEYANLKSATRVDCSSSPAFDFTFSTSIAALLSGATVVFCSEAIKNSPTDYLQYLQDKNIELLKLTPSYFSLLCLETNHPTLEKVKTIILGGEALQRTVCENWLAAYPSHQLINEYGPTETTVAVAEFKVNKDNVMSLSENIPLGTPCYHTHIRILDAKLKPVPIGVPGEMYVAGKNVARGYYNQAELTQTYFIDCSFEEIPQRYYKTGDLARWTGAGQLEYLGRVAEPIKLHGYRIDVNEIANVLKKHGDVAEAVVIIRDDYLVAYYIPGEFAPSQSELSWYLAQHLPAYMLPTWYVAIDSLPLNANGKLDQTQLPALPNTLPKQHIVYPRTAMEAKMAQIWSDVLGQTRISVNESFFAMGGHSLLALQLISRMNDALNVSLKISDLMRYPSIELLCAAQQENELWPARIVLLAGNENASKKLFIMPGSAGNPYSYLPLAQLLKNDIAVYGLRYPGLDVNIKKYRSVEKIAAYYVEGILSIQTLGPFYLAGHSFGGLVAYQVACQLLEEGQSVAELIMLDTVAPHYLHSDADTRDEIDWLLGIARVLTSYTGLAINISRETLASANNVYEYYLQALVSAKIIPLTKDVGLVKTLIEVHRSSSLASQKFKPLSYAGKITLIKAKERIVDADIPNDWGWGALATGGVNIIATIGDHITMITEPHVAALANEFLLILGK